MTEYLPLAAADIQRCYFAAGLMAATGSDTPDRRVYAGWLAVARRMGAHYMMEAFDRLIGADRVGTF